MTQPILKDVPVSCDACVDAEPVWRYDVPPGTKMLTLADVRTGKIVDQSMSAGAMGFCNGCDRTIREPLPVVVRANVLARRMVNSPSFRGSLTIAQRRAGKAAIAAMFRRLLPRLANRRPSKHGDDYMDGKVLYMDPDAPSSASLN